MPRYRVPKRLSVAGFDSDIARVSDGTRTRDRLDHNQGVDSSLLAPFAALEPAFQHVEASAASLQIPLDTGESPCFRTQSMSWVPPGTWSTTADTPRTLPRRRSGCCPCSFRSALRS